MEANRGHLCPRCGAVIAPQVLAQDEGACPECELGFSSRPLTAGRSSHQRRTADRQRSARRRIQVFSDCTFQVYGLDAGWEGARWLRGWGYHDDRLTSVTLAHGPADLEAASVSVEISVGEHAWNHTATSLAQNLYRDGADATAPLRATFDAQDPTASWDPLTLIVDGHPMEWRALAGPHSWVAIASVEGAVVGVHANLLGPASCRLAGVSIDDYRSDPTGLFATGPE